VTRQARASKIGVATQTSSLEAFVDADLASYVTALYGNMPALNATTRARLRSCNIGSLSVNQAAGCRDWPAARAG
jgi:hypothetical protein